MIKVRSNCPELPALIRMRKDFDNLGIVFMDTDSAVQEYPELVKKYFGKLIPPADNKMPKSGIGNLRYNS